MSQARADAIVLLKRKNLRLICKASYGSRKEYPIVVSFPWRPTFNCIGGFDKRTLLPDQMGAPNFRQHFWP